MKLYCFLFLLGPTAGDKQASVQSKLNASSYNQFKRFSGLPFSSGLSVEEERYLINAAKEVGVIFQKACASEAIGKPFGAPAAQKVYHPSLPKVSDFPVL